MDLVGRDDLLREARVALGARRHTLLVGPPGSGRTALVRALTAHLARAGRPHHQVAGHDSVAGVPLAAVAPLVAAVGVRVDDPMDVYTRVPPLLRAADAVVLVDDVDRVDRGAAVLLAQIARADVPLVLTTRATADVPHGVADAVRQAGMATRQLTPLSTDDVLRLAADRLGDELDVPSAARLVTAARGLPELVVEMLEAGRRGMETSDAGVRLGPDVLTDRLRARARARLDALGPAARDVAALVTAADRVLEEAVDLAGADEAVSAGVLRRLRTGLGTALEVADPVIGATLREALGERGLADCRERARVLLARGDVHRATLLAVRSGASPEPSAIVAAVEEALVEHRVEDAADLLAAVDEPADATTDGALATRLALLRGVVKGRSGETAAAVEALRAAAAAVQAPDLAVRIGHELGLTLAVRADDPRAAVEAVADLAARLGPEHGRALAADLVKWRLMAGLPATEVPVVSAETPVLDRAAEGVAVAVIAAMVSSLDGPTSAAHDAVADGRAGLACGVGPAYAEDLLTLSEYLALSFEGRLADAEDLAGSRRERAILEQHPSAGLWAYATAELALHRGLLVAGHDLARRAARHLQWEDFTGVRETNRALLEVLASRSGLRPSDPALPSAEARADVKVDLHAARLEAADLLARRRPVEAATALARVADRAMRESHAHLGLMAIDEALLVTTCDADRAAYAAVLAAHPERSRLVVALTERAEALVDGDVRRLEEAADGLRDVGLLGRAAQAYETAARLHHDRGAREAARRVRVAGADLSARGATAWPSGALAASLSPRELEIAWLAARRARSKEIAETLGLSVRTVDNHLGRIFRKLAVTGRDELADTWGR